MQSIDLIETYVSGTSKDLVNKKREIKCSNIIKRYKKMINFGDVIKETIQEHNPNWPQIPDHPCKILIIGGSLSGKRNSLFNLINQQPDINKIYSYAKDPYDVIYQFLNNNRKSTGLKNGNGSKAFIENSNDMDDIYKNIEECSPNKKRETLIVFNDCWYG